MSTHRRRRDCPATWYLGFAVAAMLGGALPLALGQAPDQEQTLLPAQVAEQGQVAPTPQPPELPQPKLVPIPNLLLTPDCPADGGPGGKAKGRPTTPQPSSKVIKVYSQFIEKTVEPENVLDLVVGIPKLLVFKLKPRLVQFAEEGGKSAVLVHTEVSPKELSLVGQKVGKTVMNLWFPDPANPGKERILSYLVRVREDPESAEEELRHQQARDRYIKERRQRFYKDLEKDINCAFPDSRVCLTIAGQNLLVGGQARDTQEANAILRMLNPRLFALGAQGQAKTIITTDRGLAGSRTEITPPENETGQPMPVDQFGIPLVTTIDQKSDVGLGTQRNYLNVINMLRVPGEQQVMLRVTVAEVNRAAARSIGVDFSLKSKSGIPVFTNNTGNLISGGGGGANAGAAALLSGVANLPTVLDNGQILLAINALKNLNLARSLAEPTLTAINGQSASFQAGGSFPVPIVTGFTASGLQGVGFVPFGVQVQFTPLIADKDRIRLLINAQVSTRDNQDSANVAGTTVPSLSQRNFQTTVELRPGQTLAVAGLLQNNFAADATRVPFFGDLPLIGRFGAFDRTSLGEQELIMLITPELVHPLDAHQKRPPLPGADVFEPSDLEFYLGARLESRRAFDYRSPVMTDWERRRQYHRCEIQYIFGPQGHSDGRP